METDKQVYYSSSDLMTVNNEIDRLISTQSIAPDLLDSILQNLPLAADQQQPAPLTNRAVQVTTPTPGAPAQEAAAEAAPAQRAEAPPAESAPASPSRPLFFSLSGATPQQNSPAQPTPQPSLKTAAPSQQSSSPATYQAARFPILPPTAPPSQRPILTNEPGASFKESVSPSSPTPILPKTAEPTPPPFTTLTETFPIPQKEVINESAPQPDADSVELPDEPLEFILEDTLSESPTELSAEPDGSSDPNSPKPESPSDGAKSEIKTGKMSMSYNPTPRPLQSPTPSLPAAAQPPSSNPAATPQVTPVNSAQPNTPTTPPPTSSTTTTMATLTQGSLTLPSMPIANSPPTPAFSAPSAAASFTAPSSTFQSPLPAPVLQQPTPPTSALPFANPKPMVPPPLLPILYPTLPNINPFANPNNKFDLKWRKKKKKKTDEEEEEQLLLRKVEEIQE